MLVDFGTVCKLLGEQDNILILAHQKPDGDTLGASFALLYALEALGKTARVECSDGYPSRYDFIYGEYSPREFEPSFVVSVDVASAQLLGGLREAYENRIDLCIDHHKSNELTARYTLLDPESPATALMVYTIVQGLGVRFDNKISNAIFTGISTDTGCFKYDNVTSAAHRVAAEMIDCGAQHGLINKLMFDTKSQGRMEIDMVMLNSLEYYFDGRCAVVSLPADILERYGVTEEEMDGVASFPRRIEGVLAGVSLREKGDGSYRVSLRTGGGVDASRICMAMGGGGHTNAAGCTLTGSEAEVRAQVLAEVRRELERLGI